MKLRPSLHLSIPEPCGQSWEQMSPRPGGRHCGHCRHIVTDFSRMTDAALLEHVQQHGLGCGRFRADQLDRIIAAPAVPESKWWVRAAAALGLLFSLSRDAAAQEVPYAGISPQPQASPDMGRDGDTVPFSGQVVLGPRSQSSGNVRAAVRLPASGLYVETGADGRFTLHVPKALLQDDLLVEILALAPSDRQYDPLKLRWRDIARMRTRVFTLGGSFQPERIRQPIQFFTGFVVQSREIWPAYGKRNEEAKRSRAMYAPGVRLQEQHYPSQYYPRRKLAVAALLKRLPSFRTDRELFTWAQKYPWLQRRRKDR